MTFIPLDEAVSDERTGLIKEVEYEPDLYEQAKESHLNHERI